MEYTSKSMHVETEQSRPSDSFYMTPITPPPEETDDPGYTSDTEDVPLRIHYDDKTYDLCDGFSNIQLNSPSGEDMQHRVELSRWTDAIGRYAQSLVQMCKAGLPNGHVIHYFNITEIWLSFGRECSLTWDEYRHLREMCTNLYHYYEQCNILFNGYHKHTLSTQTHIKDKIRVAMDVQTAITRMHAEASYILHRIFDTWEHIQKKPPPQTTTTSKSLYDMEDNVVEGTKWLITLMTFYAQFGGELPASPRMVMELFRAKWSFVMDEDTITICHLIESRFGNTSFDLICDNWTNWLQVNSTLLPRTIHALIQPNIVPKPIDETAPLRLVMIGEEGEEEFI